MKANQSAVHVVLRRGSPKRILIEHFCCREVRNLMIGCDDSIVSFERVYSKGMPKFWSHFAMYVYEKIWSLLIQPSSGSRLVPIVYHIGGSTGHYFSNRLSCCPHAHQTMKHPWGIQSVSMGPLTPRVFTSTTRKHMLLHLRINDWSTRNFRDGVAIMPIDFATVYWSIFTTSTVKTQHIQLKLNYWC